MICHLQAEGPESGVQPELEGLRFRGARGGARHLRLKPCEPLTGGEVLMLVLHGPENQGADAESRRWSQLKQREQIHPSPIFVFRAGPPRIR